MRIGRVEIDGAPRAAVISPDWRSARVQPREVGVLDLLSAGPSERERVAAQAVHEIELAQTRLVAPVRPSTVRDFSVFEQHIEGVRLGHSPAATVPPVWYESPFCYFSNPHAVNGPGAEIPVPPGAPTSTSSSRWRR